MIEEPDIAFNVVYVDYADTFIFECPEAYFTIEEFLGGDCNRFKYTKVIGKWK